MKVVICSALWKRPELSKIFIKQLHRIREKYGIEAVVVGSEKQASRGIAKGTHYLEVTNNPLGNKWNRALRKCRSRRASYVIMLGSDDFISDAWLEHWLSIMKTGVDFIASTDAWFYHNGVLKYWPGYTCERRGEPIGMGKAMSANLLNQLQWRPFSRHVNKGLDGTANYRIRNKDFTSKIVNLKESGLFAVDVKHGNSITAWWKVKGKDVSVDHMGQIAEWPDIKLL